MKISNKFIVTLVILLITTFTASSSASVEDGIPHFMKSSSAQEKRLLNTCATFLHDGSSWKVDGTGDTLNQHCTANDCCSDGNGGAVNSNSECAWWNRALPYTICNGACKGMAACYGIAGNASGGSVKINSNACTSFRLACWNIGQNIFGNVDIEIGENACTSIDATCSRIGYNAQSLTRIEVPANECNEENTAGVTEMDGDVVAKCFNCGSSSAFEGTFQATDACCGADGTYYYYGTKEDEACNYTPPSESPSVSSVPSPPPVEPEEPTNPCKNVSCSNRGKCQVLSLTEAECQCENTFIQSENKLDCICPSNHEFHADANRCFPITEAPSKSPTMSPIMTSSTSPSQVPTVSQVDVCEDDETATFQLIKMEWEVPCSWITKNWKKRAIREERYCGLDEVKAICPATCGLCS